MSETPGANTKKRPILIVSDPNLGRERQASLIKTWALLRTVAPVQILPPSTTEEQLIKHIETSEPALTLLPWNRYLSWSRVEGQLGLGRIRGATSAGYFGAPLDRHEIGPQNSFQRLILLDFSSTLQAERLRLVRALHDENLRSGLRPLVHPKVLLLHEPWTGSHSPGDTLHALLAMESLRREPWKQRQCAIQSITLALWNLAFEQGRAIAAGNWLTQIHADRVRAYFEIAHDNDVLAFRLCYQQNPNTAKALVRDYWPQSDSTDDFRQLLLQHADFVRVHPVADRHEVELVAGLLKSAPAKQRPNELRTTWIEPLSLNVISEIPSERGKGAYDIPLQNSGPAPTVEAMIRLECEVAERDARIQELLGGGIADAADPATKLKAS